MKWFALWCSAIPPTEQDVFSNITPWELGLLVAGLLLTLGLVILFAVIFIRAGREKPDGERSR